MKSFFFALAASASVLAAVPGPASASTMISISTNPVTANDNGLLINSGSVGDISLGTGTNVTSDIGVNTLDGFDPWGSADTNSQWDSVGGCCGLNGSQSLAITGQFNTLSFLWGSPNSNNTVVVTLGGDTITYVDGVGFEVDGVVQPGTVLPNDTSSGHIVSITSSSELTGATLTNSVGGFEVADFSVSQTPLPGALPLLATGLAAMGLLGWRRKKKATALAA